MLHKMFSLFGSFHGVIRISDGCFGEFTDARKIICRQADGVKEFTTNGEIITGVKYRVGNKLAEHMIVNKFHKGYTQFDEKRIPGPVFLRYKSGNWRRVLHGISIRKNVKLFGYSGTCKTMYSSGRFVWQEFTYENRRRAYRLHHRDVKVVIKYPDGNLAGIVEVSPAGFSTNTRYSGYYSARRQTVSVRNGLVIFPFENGFRMGEVSDFDFSKNGHCSIQFWGRDGRVAFKGKYRDFQRVEDWIVDGKAVYLMNGIEVDKKLWETPPEKLKFGAILREKNAQIRSALIARAGYKRLVMEYRHKVIHVDKRRGNQLLEFPIKVSDGNGGRESNLRILVVRCPSTRSRYYLNVPDFVWDGGNKTKLDTCEAARQWTFGVDNPRERVKFALET